MEIFLKVKKKFTRCNKFIDAGGLDVAALLLIN